MTRRDRRARRARRRLRAERPLTVSIVLDSLRPRARHLGVDVRVAHEFGAWNITGTLDGAPACPACGAWLGELNAVTPLSGVARPDGPAAVTLHICTPCRIALAGERPSATRGAMA